MGKTAIEMKCLHLLIKPITKLFHLILNSQHYPTEWSNGRNISIHKMGMLAINPVSSLSPVRTMWFQKETQAN